MVAVPKFARTTPILDALRIEPIERVASNAKLQLVIRLGRNRHTRSILEQILNLPDGKKWTTKLLIHDAKTECSNVKYCRNATESDGDALINKAAILCAISEQETRAQQTSERATQVRACLADMRSPTARERLFTILEIPDFARQRQY